MEKIELNRKLAADIVKAAVSGNPTKKVIEFFAEFSPLGHDFSKFKYNKLKDNKVALTQFLNLDFLLYHFVSTDFGITDNLRSLYRAYIIRRDYYTEPKEVVRGYIIRRLNDLISFREYVVQEFSKIAGPLKIVKVRYTNKPYNTWESWSKRTLEINSYGNNREAISKVLSKFKRESSKIHSTKVRENRGWNKYSLPFCNSYKELIKKYRVPSAIIFDN